LDGIYFEYDESISPNWRLKTASNGSRTTTTTDVAVAINVWIKLRIETNRAGSEVLFFINDQFVGNIITNIPNTVGRNTDLLYKIVKSAGLGARTVLADYCLQNSYLNR
jgi:alkyl hydroperoxide reductase subunit AhpC